jgi:hypothetical protein
MTENSYKVLPNPYAWLACNARANGRDTSMQIYGPCFLASRCYWPFKPLCCLQG